MAATCHLYLVHSLLYKKSGRLESTPYMYNVVLRVFLCCVCLESRRHIITCRSLTGQCVFTGVQHVASAILSQVVVRVAARHCRTTTAVRRTRSVRQSLVLVSRYRLMIRSRKSGSNQVCACIDLMKTTQNDSWCFDLN